VDYAVVEGEVLGRFVSPAGLAHYKERLDLRL
jgi:hypothetical protein